MNFNKFTLPFSHYPFLNKFLVMKTKSLNKFSNTIRNLFFKSLNFVFLISALLGLNTYAQQSFTFTPCGATGQFGPTQTQVNTAYASTNLNNSVTVTSGIQTFTIPFTGNYRIEAYGAQGGSITYAGGLGAKMAGDFTLTAGTVLKILVGQAGINGLPTYNSDAQQSGGTGGGGSFVSTLTNTALIVAGGGGGSSLQGSGGGVNATGAGGTVGINGLDGGGATASGGINGTGGLTYNWSGWHGGTGGGGFTGDGVNNSAGFTTYGTSNTPGLAFVNGGAGGTGGSSGRPGGFGGGGASGFTGAGGGGYSGGGAGTLTGGVGGGGGGSYNAGSNQANVSATNSGDGKVVIISLCTITISAMTANGPLPAICSGNSLTLTTNAVSNYTWSTGNSTSTSIVVSPTSSQSYSIIGTSSTNCVASSAISVTVSTGSPVISVSNPSSNICLGRSTTLTASGALSYTWSSGITNGVAFTPSVTNSYTVAGQNGCGTATTVTSISVAPLSVTAVANPTNICIGTTSSLSANSAANAYTWQPVNGVGQGINVSPMVNTIYTVTASDGTCSGTATVYVATKQSPIVTAAASSSVGCANAVYTLTANGASTYTWSPINLSGATVTVSPGIPTSYQVIGSNSLGCNSATSIVIITQAGPTVVATTNKTLVCVNGTAILSASGAQTYQWSGGPSTSSYTVNPIITSNYTITGTDAVGCTDTKTVLVSVFSPSVSVNTITSSICSGKSTTLIASGANTYTWNNGLGSNANVAVSPTISTGYTVSANTTSNNLSCPSSNSLLITVYNNPNISIAATKTVMCRKDPAALLTASGGVTYLWNNNAVTNTLIASSASATTTTYSVVGTDANGCVNTSSIVIKVNACTGINEQSFAASNISIYPNPNNGEFQINAKTNIQLKLVNELGQLLRTFELNAENGYKVDIRDLPNGIYFIIGIKDENTFSQKIIVTK